MKTRQIMYVCVIILISLISSPGFALAVNSTTLIEQPKIYDNKSIEFTGEVIGDVMIRGEFAWINVNDDPYSLGKKGSKGYNSGQSIWVTDDMAKKIKRTGGYFWYGDKIRVEGIFNRVCKIHGGDMDIHASRFEIISRGKPIKRSINISKIVTSIILLTLVIIVYIINFFVKQRRLAEV